MKPIRTLAMTLVIALAGTMFAPATDAQSSRKPASSRQSSVSQPSRPKYTPPQRKDPPSSQPKYTPAQPKFTPSSGTSDSKRPVTKDGLSNKARAAEETRSKRMFQETHKAVQPPVPKYTTPDGKTVAVRTASKDVAVIRSMPISSLKPEVRRQTTVTHITQYHYHHDYNWYRSQPVVYVGGGYSSTFWWMMAEWDAERRARWLYNHHYDIEASAYERGVRDAQVAAAINRMEAQRAYRDPSYIDSEFSKSPQLMYTQDYINAAYNPPVVRSSPSSSGAALTVFLVLGAIVLLVFLCCVIYAICFRVRWGS